MKILLYEPHSSGHHGVVLKYVQTILDGSRIAYVTINESVAGRLGGEFLALQQEGRSQQVDLIHVLSIDGRVKDWLVHRPYSNARGIPIVANYYLYNSLYQGLIRWGWWWLLQRRLVSRLLISDDFWREHRYLARVRQSVRYVPDPWSEAEFPAWTLEDARARLNLPAAKRVLLLFGEISWRKGADVLLNAFLENSDPQTDLLLFAGSVAGDLDKTNFHAQLQVGLDRGSVRLDRGFVPEAEVSVYFHACDAVACVYPSWFQVSSGTFTRACAAGRPVLASDAGVTGRMAREHALGYIYPADDYAGLTRALCTTLAEAVGKRADPSFCESAQAVAKARNLDAYGRAMLAAYRELIPAG